MEFITTGNRIAVENFDIGKIYTITWQTGNYKSLACTGKGTDFVMFQDQEPELLFCLTMDSAITVSSIDEGGGGAGTMNYNELENKPSINGFVLVGNKTGADLGLASQSDLEDYATNASVVAGLATKQDALSSSQLAAVNSGIDSTKVAQIDTNKNNILSKIVYGTCSTASATAAKVVDVPSGFVLQTGCIVAVLNSNSNTAASATINVGGTGAKGIAYLNNRPYTGTSAKVVGNKNVVNYYMYDGEYWNYVTQAQALSAMNQSEASAGTSTNERLITAKVLSDTIDEKIQPLENNISSLYNSGQKNHLSINTATYTASGSNRALKIPVDSISGTIHIYFGEITSTDTDDTTCGVLLLDSNDNTIQTVQFGRGTNKDVSVYVGSTAVASVSIYPATNWTNSADDTVSITNGMICSQDAWGATGGTYEPYAMSNADITAWIIAHS